MLTEATRLRDFPALAGVAYLNTAAESIPPRCVGDAIHTYWEDKLTGMRGRDAHFAQAEACREVSERMLGLQPAEVSFCSCTSEAYNLLASALQLTARDEVVVTDIEFPSGFTPWLRAAEPPTMRLWKSVQGALDPRDLQPLLNAKTRLVQVSLVSFYNGHRLAWASFREMVRRLAPNAVISVDLTQALGRVVLDCDGADIYIASSYKWTLGIHGGCIIGVPEAGAERLTTRAGGWLHIQNAFQPDRFEHADSRTGAASFAVGMPNFVALYALDASLRYLEEIGVANIAAHADPLVQEAEAGLRTLGIEPLARWDGSGILAFQHPRSAELNAALVEQQVHIMHQAGRMRIAVHGYNSQADIRRFLQVLGSQL